LHSNSIVCAFLTTIGESRAIPSNKSGYCLIVFSRSSNSAIICFTNCLDWLLSSFCSAPDNRWRAPVIVNPSS